MYALLSLTSCAKQGDRLLTSPVPLLSNDTRCCSNAAWKRENVPDHKFDFVNVHEFHTSGCGTRLQYVWLYVLVVKSFAVYVADVYTAIALLASNRWSGSILQSSAAQNGSTSATVLEVPFNIGKWIFTGCIIFSFLLLAWETRKARAIVKSRDISYAFTNVMSQNWYSLRSYDHFCFFCQINNSKKKKDEFAFFVFFTFKGWKSLLLADAPRQVVNAITLYSFGKSEGWTTDIGTYFGGSILKAGIIITMLFTLVVWVGSALLLLIAAIMYVPLLCYIQGNLKEYCCHKVDKRIAELMKRKNRKRLAKEADIARREAKGDYSHLKDKTGKFVAAPLPQPTLPKVGLGDDDLYSHAGSDAGSIRGGRGNYGYPPPNPNPYGGGGWNAPPLARPGFAYMSSDQDLNQKAYAESVTSLDGFAGRGAPMGMGYADSSANLMGMGMQDGRPGLSRGPTQTGLSRAPTYRSEDEKYGYVEDYKPNSGAELVHSNSISQSQSQHGAYIPPSTRQQLYERSGRERQVSQDTTLAYGRRDSALGGGAEYGGWEESTAREVVAQEYYPDDGNMAGRGARAYR